MLIDLETGAAIEVSEDYVQGRHRERIDAHVGTWPRGCGRAGIRLSHVAAGSAVGPALRTTCGLRTGRGMGGWHQRFRWAH